MVYGSTALCQANLCSWILLVNVFRYAGKEGVLAHSVFAENALSETRQVFAEGLHIGNVKQTGDYVIAKLTDMVGLRTSIGALFDMGDGRRRNYPARHRWDKKKEQWVEQKHGREVPVVKWHLIEGFSGSE